MIDDLLNTENTATQEQRDKAFSWVQQTVNTRLDTRGTRRLIITNTARHPDDVAHKFRDKMGAPTLRLGASGDIYVEGNVDPRWAVDDAIAKELRGRTDSPYEVVCRLTAHDPDPQNLVPLWPEKLDRAGIEHIKTKLLLPLEYEQLYEQNCRDDSTSLCKREYIEACRRTAIELGVTDLAAEWRGGADDTAFTGVDLSTGEGTDLTAIFTFYVRPADKIRVVLDVRYGLWDAPEILEQIVAVQAAFNSVVRVEDNATQKFIRQLLRASNRSLPINDHHTDGAKKKDPVFGINRIFVDMKNGAWALPTRPDGSFPAPVQKFVHDCLYYKPSKHTPDLLMACHFALAQAAEWGVLTPATAGDVAAVRGLAAGLMQR